MLPSVKISDYALANINITIKDSFKVSTSGTTFELPELSVLTAYLATVREIHLSQDDVNILLDIAKKCQQHHYVVHAVCLYTLLYRAKKQNVHHDTHTLLFYQTQLTPLLSQPPCTSKQIAFQSAQGTFHQPVAIQASDTWFDVGLHFQQSALLHYLLCHGELSQALRQQSTEKETSDGRMAVTHQTVLHRLCRSGITDVSLYQRCIKMWPQALVAQTVKGHLPVHQAACFANQDVFDYVTKKTTKATACVQADSQGNSLLHLAAMYANTEVVNLLLPQADVGVNARNADNGTPLHCAALGRQLKQGRTLSDYAAVFNSLLVQGADPMAVDNHQNTARDIIRLSGNVTLLTVFDKVLNCTAPERLWQYWQTAMMSYYCKETFVNKRLFNDDYFSLVNYFVNLQVVKERDGATQGQQPSDDKPAYQPLRERDRLAGKKETVELADLFQPSTYQDKGRETLSSINTVVLSGAAGVGKTTLMNYLAYQWALAKKGEGETGLWSTFETVLIIRCRDLYPEALKLEVKEKSLADLLRCACWGQLDVSLEASRQLLAMLKKKPDKCLLLFDGLDELPEPKQAYWRDLLEQLFQLPFKKLVTTRPYAVGKLQQWISHEGLVEISGFSDSNVAVYFEKMLGQSNETEEFIQSVKKNPDLWAITHIPIHAYLLKSWWVTTGSQVGGAPLATLSISGLYRSLIVDVCRRYLAKTAPLNGSELVDDEVVLNNPRVHRLLDALGRWAFEGLRQDSAQLPMSWLSGIQDSDEKPTLLSTSQCEQLEVDYLKKVGLLKEVGSHIGAQQRFEFLHLSFQEFLAANVIAVTLRQSEKAEKPHLTQVIHRYKYDLNFTLVWPSVAGLLRRYPAALNDFLSILITGPKDWVGFVEADLLMRCLEASLPASTDTKALGLQQQALLRVVKQRIKRLNKLPQKWRRATVKILSMCPRLICLNADTVLAFLRDEKAAGYVRCELASGAVAHWSPTPELVEVVFALFRDEKVDLYLRVKLASGAVAHWSPTSELVEVVFALFRDEKVDVYLRVKLASGAGAHWSSTPEWVEAVWVFLRDEQVDRYVRGELASGAGAHWSSTPEWVEAVWVFLQDEQVDRYVRCRLASSAVAHWSPTPELVEAVWVLLRDEKVDGYVRCELASGAVAHWSSTPEWVEAVWALLRDEQVDRYVRCELASRAVAHWSPTPEWVEAVWVFLRDEKVDGVVRGQLASDAVAHWPLTSELMEAVWAFLQDEQVDGVVRGDLTSSAVAHWPPISEWLEVVFALFRDEEVDGVVRGDLASGAVAHWSPTSEWVDEVLVFLRDEKVAGVVRGELASGAVAHWPPTSELVEAVWALLRDEKVGGYVRSKLASDAVAHWSSTPEWMEAVLVFLQDEQVDSRVRGDLASGAGAHWPPTSEWVEAVWAFLRDEKVDVYVRGQLASSTVAHWSPTPEWVEAVLTLFRDEKVDEYVRGTLATSVIQQLPKWPNKAQAFLDSLFVKDSVMYSILHDIDIPVHLLLPLYKKAHDKGRQYIRERLIKHGVLVYEQAGTVLVTQEGQTEKLTLPPSIIQQIQKALQPYRINVDNSVSTISKLNLFSQKLMRFFSSKHNEKSNQQTSRSHIRRVMQ